MLLPSSSLDDLLFPMTASVFYAQTRQEDYGNVTKAWVYDRTINCSIISGQSDGQIGGELQTKGKDFIYNSNVFLRTAEDIRLKSNGDYVPITAISIGNVLDPSGKSVWINGQQSRLSSAAVNTKYEVKTIVPTFDYNHNFRHFRIFLSKSQIQRWD